MAKQISPKKTSNLTVGVFEEKMDRYLTVKRFDNKMSKYLTIEEFEKRIKDHLKGYVTIERFDNAMASIALSFERADNRLTQLADAMMNQFQEIRAENREFRKTMADHAIHISRHEHKIDDITERVEVIEKKVA